MSNSTERSRSSGLFWGGFLILLGILFLLDRFGYLDVGKVFSTFWPLILIAIGIKLILNRNAGEARQSGPKAASETEQMVTSDASVRHTKVFGDVEMKIDSTDFNGGSVSTVFGDIDIDLSAAKLGNGEKILTLSGVFGDVTVNLPRNIKTSVRANVILGDIRILELKDSGLFVNRSFQSEGYESAAKKLYISASQVFGDIEIVEKG